MGVEGRQRRSCTGKGAMQEASVAGLGVGWLEVADDGDGRARRIWSEMVAGGSSSWLRSGRGAMVSTCERDGRGEGEGEEPEEEGKEE